MSNLGMGVMINMLAGSFDKSRKVFADHAGKRIAKLWLGPDDDGLHFVFDDGSRMRLFDDGQSCCETRYMRTDDDLAAFVGATLIDAEVREGGEVEGKYEIHETEFLIVTTSAGQFTMVSHNEHNGYYGGFSIQAQAESDE